MRSLTDEEIAARKAAGVSMYRLNCGWNLTPAELAEIVSFINEWNPKTEVEKRDKHILELAFIEDMNAAQIERLQDPLIIGMGNRNHGSPLSASWIWGICVKYAPQANKANKREPNQTRKKRNALYRQRQQGEIVRQKTCATCGSAEKIELHHIIPIAAGGTNDYYNLVSLCHDCHQLLHRKIYDSLQWKNSSFSNLK